MCFQELDPLYKMNYVGTESTTPLRCTYHGCDREYKTRKTLRNHQKVKHAEWFYAGKSELSAPAKRPSGNMSTPTAITSQELPAELDEGEENTAFLCNIDNCGASFSNYNDLTKHNESAHSLETRHLCAYPGCERSFAHRQSMYRHQREQHKEWVIAHGGVPIPAANNPSPAALSKLRCPFAPVCRSTFTTRSSLRRHLRNFHDGQMMNGLETKKDKQTTEEDDDDKDEEEEEEETYDDEEDEEERYLEEEKLEKGLVTEGEMKVTADDGTLELESCLDDNAQDKASDQKEEKDESDEETIMDLGDEEEDEGAVLDLDEEAEGGKESDQKEEGEEQDEVVLDLDDPNPVDNENTRETNDSVEGTENNELNLGEGDNNDPDQGQVDNNQLDLGQVDNNELDLGEVDDSNVLDLGQVDASELNFEEMAADMSLDLGEAGKLDF